MRIGIIVAGKGVDGRGYVLSDRSCKLSPEGWSRRAIEAYHEFRADCVIAERNFRGAMVEHVLRTAGSRSWRSTGASRSITASMQLRRLEAIEADIAALDLRIGERLEPYSAPHALLMQIPGRRQMASARRLPWSRIASPSAPRSRC